MLAFHKDDLDDDRGSPSYMSMAEGLTFRDSWLGVRSTPADTWRSVLLSIPQSPLLMLLLLVLGVVCVRLPFFDYTVLSVDESVYLMIGSGMRHGLIPYVDIIDRKPIGIFLIFAAADALFTDPLFGVRIFGALFTIAGSWMIARIGQRFLGLGPVAGMLAGLLYSTYALLFYGDSGQTPVFFMPFVILGGGLVLRELRRIRRGTAPDVARLGFAGLALGLSLQIKYSTFFECVFFGGMLLYTTWQFRALLGYRGLKAAMLGICTMIGGGLLPTIVAYLVYATLGHADAFTFYNFTSNLDRQATDFPASLILFRAFLFMLAVLPLVILSAKYVWSRLPLASEDTATARQRWVHNALALWFLSALVAGLAQQQPYATYFFDTLAPLALIAAANFQSRTNAPRSTKAIAWTAGIVFALGISGYVGLHIQKIRDNGSPYLPATIAQDIKAEGADSLYVFNYYGILYPLTGIALPTRYPLPDHLLRDLEAASYQFDAIAELNRILGNNPDMIVVQSPLNDRIPQDRREILADKLTSEYCLWRAYDAGPQTVNVYMHKETSTLVAGTACQQPIDPNAWITATSKPGDKRRVTKRGRA